jgi:hypothetical protein
MSNQSEKTFTAEEAHRFFAVNCFNNCWTILENNARTKEDEELLIHLAHTSLYHWMQVGKPINQLRGEWMLARVYTVLENKERALHHALRCLELTQQQNLNDFDLAYGYECAARAYALNHDAANFKRYYSLAEAAEKQIKEEEDRKLFHNDLTTGKWFGLK